MLAGGVPLAIEHDRVWRKIGEAVMGIVPMIE
jgi:hypothetical protein